MKDGENSVIKVCRKDGKNVRGRMRRWKKRERKKKGEAAKRET